MGLVATMRLVHGGHDGVLGAERLGMEVRVVEGEVLLQLGGGREPERALGALKNIHPPSFDPWARKFKSRGT